MSSRRLETLALLTLGLVLLPVGPSSAEHTALWEPLPVPKVALYTKPNFEQAMLADLNAARQRAGLPPLKLDPRLTTLARSYAKLMLTRGFIGHVTPDGTTLDLRLKAAQYPYMAAGENLVYTDGDEHRAYQSLDESPSHHANMFDKRFVKVGIGAISVSIYSTMYVQEFADE
jgi:uncharacterized protein YkwD